MNYQQQGNGYYLAVGESDIGGQAIVNSYDDCCPPIFVGELIQSGGKYNYITNPKTGRKVSIYGKLGKKILKNYITQFGGKL